MFSTFQGGPFVEVFTPQVSARPAARHRISSEPALGCRKARNIPWWRAPRAKGGTLARPGSVTRDPILPAPGRLDDLGTRAGRPARVFFPPRSQPTPPPPAPTRDQHSLPLTRPLHRG